MDYNQLKDKEVFTRNDYLNAMKQTYSVASENAVTYSIRKNISDNVIIHIGRDQYSFADDKKIYTHAYSNEAVSVAKIIQSEYNEAEFQIMELIQLNPFINHQIAHNSIFVFVENNLLDYVFGSIKNKYPGKVLIKPTLDNYYRYHSEDQIVILRLPSEAPKVSTCPWHSRLEKILVDVTVDKLLSNLISNSEYPELFRNAFSQYIIDRKAMYRYANRRGAKDKFNSILKQFEPFTGENDQQ